MKKTFGIFIVLIQVILFTGISFSKEYKANHTLYSWVDRLSFRAEPSLKSKILGFLAEGEAVECTGKITKTKTKISLRGKEFNDPWVEVKRETGKKGWAFAGGLTDKQPGKNIVHWRAVIVYDPAPNDESSEDWGWFVAQVRQSVIVHGIIVTSGGVNEKVEIKQGKVLLAQIDLAKIMKKEWKEFRGYLFVQKGKDAAYEQHNMPVGILSSASKYFGFNIEFRDIE